jgi:endonuclease/exonuclease/phosphatase family metal-dependent hydrolase
MPFRIVTLNLEQDHKRWERRRPLIEAEIARLKPDIVGLNEVSIPLQTARTLRRTASAACDRAFNLVQQTRVNGLSEVEGEALLSSFPVLETGNLDFRTQDIVALVARLDIGGTPVDVYVTHLYRSIGDDSLRLFQAQKLLAWIESRDDVGQAIVCGDFNATLEKPSAALMATRFARPRRRPRPSRRLPAPAVRSRIPTGQGWIAASTTSGCRRK